jgi:hypothetical protein
MKGLSVDKNEKDYNKPLSHDENPYKIFNT